jgi:hypothetical protein
MLTIANVNDAPTLVTPIPNQAADEDSPFAYTVPAATFADVDVGDTLTWSATRADGTALPAWLTFDPTTHTFSGTPAQEDVGVINLRVTVADGAAATASSTFAFAVFNTNDPPSGQPAITGTPAVGTTLAVDVSGITDSDGPGTLASSFQWLRTGTPIAGATAPTYFVDDADLGHTLAVRIGWIDGHGTPEQAVSGAIGPVQPASSPGSPPPIPYVDPSAGGGPLPPAGPATPSSGDGAGATPSTPATGGAPTSGDSPPSTSDPASGAPGAGPTAPPAGAPSGAAPPPYGGGRFGVPGSVLAPRMGPIDPGGVPAQALLLTADPTLSAPLGARPLDIPAARSDFAEVLRQWRQRVVVMDTQPDGAAPVGGLTASTASRPALGPLASDEGFTLGPADGAYITGLIATTGMVLWAARSGGMTLALLASVPIWRNLDPLYVLPSDRAAVADRGQPDEHDDPLPTTVPSNGRAAGRLVMSIDLES